MDAMVTARMSQIKKEAGNAVLLKLGMNSSLAINKFYDYLIRYRSLPFVSPELSEKEKQEAQELILCLDAIIRELQGEFDGFSSQDIRKARFATLLASKREYHENFA